MSSEWELFTVSPVFYLTIDFKKVVNDLIHAGSSLAENECIKRKTRLSEKPRNITLTSKPFYIYIFLYYNIEEPCNALVRFYMQIPSQTFEVST